jgi:hypothetical protein
MITFILVVSVLVVFGGAACFGFLFLLPGVVLWLLGKCFSAASKEVIYGKTDN